MNDTLITFNQSEYKRAVQVLHKARQIAVFGVANSAVVADDIVVKLARLGLICSSYADAHRQLIAASNLAEGDVAIGVSHSGYTIDTVDALTVARKNGAVTICISNQFTSPIIDVSDIQLLTAAHEASFISETMVSRISQLVIVDMLYSGIILQDYEYYTQKITKINGNTLGKAF
jgi:DNA-binding MurR/RpiR family transcriptional regulator